MDDTTVAELKSESQSDNVHRCIFLFSIRIRAF